MQAQFDTYGNITVLGVVRGLGYGRDENAIAALKGWRFSPALQNGFPVTAIAEIEVRFTLTPTSNRFSFKFAFSFSYSQ